MSGRVAPRTYIPGALTRSGLGDFHHPALPLLSLKELPPPYLNLYQGRWERVHAKHPRESSPRQARRLTSAAEPPTPAPLHPAKELNQASLVSIHPEVVDVPVHASDERGVLLLDRHVPVATTPVVDGLERPSQARTPCLAPHLPSTSERSTPVQREPQKIEGRRSLPTRLLARRPAEVEQSGLVRVEGQSVAPQPLTQNTHDPICILFVLKAYHEIICISDEQRFALHSRTNFALEPHIENVVQIDVSEKW